MLVRPRTSRDDSPCVESDHVPVLECVGTPLLPTLGSPTRSLDEIYQRLGDLPFAAEYKYDGQRAQIHAFGSHAGSTTVKLYSRHLEDMTDKYPDVAALVQRYLLSRVDSSTIGPGK